MFLTVDFNMTAGFAFSCIIFAWDFGSLFTSVAVEEVNCCLQNGQDTLLLGIGIGGPFPGIVACNCPF